MSTIPEGTKRTIDMYVEHKLEPGGFVRAVLENNLIAAFGRADANNRKHLFEITCYVYNDIPSNSHGSPEIVSNWLKAEPRGEND